jgi:hypothetical protein
MPWTPFLKHYTLRPKLQTLDRKPYTMILTPQTPNLKHANPKPQARKPQTSSTQTPNLKHANPKPQARKPQTSSTQTPNPKPQTPTPNP